MCSNSSKTSYRCTRPFVYFSKITVATYSINNTIPVSVAINETFQRCEIGAWKLKSIQTNIGFMPFDLMIDQDQKYCIGSTWEKPKGKIPFRHSSSSNQSNL